MFANVASSARVVLTLDIYVHLVHLSLQCVECLQHQTRASVQQPGTLRLQMGVLLARSENQILVLETLLKRLVQVCVHTQDKRLAKELKLMDFTRLVRTQFAEFTYVCLLIRACLALGRIADKPRGCARGANRNEHKLQQLTLYSHQPHQF